MEVNGGKAWTPAPAIPSILLAVYRFYSIHFCGSMGGLGIAENECD
jgi:hypothetical protein